MNINYQENEQRKRKSHSWGLVIFLLIIFWPVGIFFLIRKLSIDKKASLTAGRKMTMWGWVVFSLGILASCTIIEERSFEGSSTTFFMILAGVALVIIGRRSSIKAIKYKKYIDMIVNQGMRSIATISSAIPVSPEQAIADIQEIIKKGFFQNAYIDFSKNQIIFMGEDTRDEYVQRNSMINQQVVPCVGCGANNKVAKGMVSECQYCGSLISGS